MKTKRETGGPVKSMWMRRLLMGLVLLVSAFAQKVDAKTVEHVFKGGETLWFLAQVYYGDGTRYAQILRHNRLASSETLQDGQMLKIPNVLFHSEQPGFDIRLSHLKLRRAEALARRLVAGEPTP